MKQKTSVSSVPLTPFKISISTSLNISTLSVLNWSPKDIMRNAACALLVFAFGIANAIEDQVIDGKHIYPLNMYIFILRIQLGKICTKGNQTCTL